jgi:hypothetical protein
MLFVGFVGAFEGVAVLAASCKSVMKFLHSFSMSAGSLSLRTELLHKIVKEFSLYIYIRI